MQYNIDGSSGSGFDPARLPHLKDIEQLSKLFSNSFVFSLQELMSHTELKGNPFFEASTTCVSLSSALPGHLTVSIVLAKTIFSPPLT
jgi:hypothetical protein